MQDTPTKPTRRTKARKPPVLFEQTQRVIAQIEKRLDGRFVSYWNSPNGSICQNDVVGFYEMLRQIGPQERMYLHINSGGGAGMASLRIVHLLREFTDELIALIPLDCASAATMLALGASRIEMGPLARLTAVDTSLTHDLSPIDRDNDRVSVSQDEMARIIKLWRAEAGGENRNPYPSLFQHIHPLVIGAVDRSSSLSIRLCEEILLYHMRDRRKAKAISKELNSGYPAHSYPITLKEAKRIGLHAGPMDETLNDLLLRLNELYAEMGQRAVTDFDERNQHNNEIINIIETSTTQVRYQTDKDWHYRVEERRWISLNDQSCWRKVQRVGKSTRETVVHIR